MSNNELVLLDQMLEQVRSERTVQLSEADEFELFACQQALYDRDLSTEEISEGVLGGGNDGGIDGVYVFLNDQLVHEDNEILHDNYSPKKSATGTRLEVWLVQAKSETSFSETAVERSLTQFEDCSALQSPKIHCRSSTPTNW